MTIYEAVANIGNAARYVGGSAAIPKGTVAKIISVTKQRVLVQIDYDDDRQIQVSPRSLKL
jgi:hypothetical protein